MVVVGKSVVDVDVVTCVANEKALFYVTLIEPINLNKKDALNAQNNPCLGQV
jgi:hypothetical protein